MKGRRLPIADGEDPTLILQWPGDYCGPIVGFTGDSPAVFFLLPIETHSDIHHVVSPPHKFIEEPDGSLTIKASIGADPHWHGYLKQGVWTCE